MAIDETTRLAKSNKATANKPDDSMPLGKINFILITISVLLIVIGFVLMTGSSNIGKVFNYDIFEARRIVVAPMITFAGFLLMAPAILYRPKKNKTEIEQ